MIRLTDKESQFYEKQKVCYIAKKKEFSIDDNKGIALNRKYQKVREHCHYTRKFRGAAHDICNLTCKIAMEIPKVFHNDSTYDYHFKINQLGK